MQLILKLESSPTPGEPPQKRAWISDRQTMTVGRMGGDFLLNDSKVSSRHFKITCDGRWCLLEDLQSTNGTFVNEVRVKQARLANGDKIRVGQTVFSVQITGAAVTAESSEADTGPDLIRASSNLDIQGDEPAGKPLRDEPIRIFNSTPYQFALVPGRVRFPGHSMTVVVKATFDMHPGKAVTAAKEQVPVLGPLPYPGAEHELAAPRYESDVACFKPKADLLLAGTCHAPGGQLTARCEVEFRVGQKGLRLAVTGKRKWEGLLGGAISEPQPFTQLPLRYEYAYGGEGYAKNPTGQGFVQVNAPEEGKKQLPLPQIEDLQKRVTMRVDKPEPAGFGPLGEQWEQRKKHLGTYDEAWVKTRWPWFASNFNWAFCNAAPEALQTDYLRGDEEIYLENLNVQHPKFTTKLPGRRVRCFIYEVHGDERKFREVAMALDTLWVDADKSQVTLVWRGVAVVGSKDWEEIRSIFFLDESLAAPKSSDDCLGAFRQARSDWEKQWEEGEAPAPPPAPATVVDDQPPPPDEYAPAVAAAQANTQAELRKTMVAAGIDPDNPPQPTEAEKKEAYAFLRSIGINIPENEPAGPPSPWTRNRVVEHAATGESFEGEDLHGLDLSNLPLAGANFSGANLEGVNLSNVNLTGANLSDANLNQSKLVGATLTAANFGGASLTAADLTGATGDAPVFGGARMLGADLTNVNFAAAVFAEALLIGAKLPRARLVEANLGKAKLAGANLAEADLTAADCTGVDLSGANLTGVKATEAIFVQANLTGAVLEQAQAAAAIFLGAKLNDARLAGGNFHSADFAKAVLHRTICERGIFEEATFEDADGRQANFTKARLTGARAAKAKFANAKFRQSQLSGAVFSGASLAGADFSFVAAPGCDFSKANLERAVLTGADLRQSRFEEANLKHAKLHKANLFEGSVAQADLTDADLSEANCYGVDFAEAVIDRLKSDGANFKLSRLAKA